eukprot:Sspe_Gene.14356::Locus_4962_Transcript_1_1_Confidence_1.000_Length_1387::g.14356::m.14356
MRATCRRSMRRMRGGGGAKCRKSSDDALQAMVQMESAEAFGNALVGKLALAHGYGVPSYPTTPRPTAGDTHTAALHKLAQHALTSSSGVSQPRTGPQRGGVGGGGGGGGDAMDRGRTPHYDASNAAMEAFLHRKWEIGNKTLQSVRTAGIHQSVSD